jgi:hypothetical protein
MDCAVDGSTESSGSHWINTIYLSLLLPVILIHDYLEIGGGATPFRICTGQCRSSATIEEHICVHSAILAWFFTTVAVPPREFGVKNDVIGLLYKQSNRDDCNTPLATMSM